MRTSNGRTGRLVCFVVSVLLLAAALVMLTDAVDAETVEAGRQAALAQVLAMGSVSFMIGALVWTLAGRAGDGQAGSPESYRYGPPYGAPPQPGWGPPPGHGPPPAGPPPGT